MPKSGRFDWLLTAWLVILLPASYVSAGEAIGAAAGENTITIARRPNRQLVATFSLTAAEQEVASITWYVRREHEFLADSKFGQLPGTKERRITVSDAGPGNYIVNATVLFLHGRPPVAVECAATVDEFEIAPHDASRVRALLVCDTDSDDRIGKSAAIDMARMKKFFDDAFGSRGILDITSFSGNRATRDRVLAYFRDLDSEPSETLVFYFSGHGRTIQDDQQSTHFLKLTHGERLDRSELRAEMKKKPHQCIIILTDCCSSVTRFDQQRIDQTRQAWSHLFGNDQPLPIPDPIDRRSVDRLFLRHLGTVDITSSSPVPDQFSWSHPESGIGGYFTYTLVRVLRSGVGRQAESSAHVPIIPNWRQAFDSVYSGTAALSLGRRDLPPARQLNRVPRGDQDRLWQKVHTFSLQ